MGLPRNVSALALNAGWALRFSGQGSGRRCVLGRQKYDRLDKFLGQFPLFVYQRKWVGLSDWFQEVEMEMVVAGTTKPKSGALMDCICSIYNNGKRVQLSSDKIDELAAFKMRDWHLCFLCTRLIPWLLCYPR